LGLSRVLLGERVPLSTTVLALCAVCGVMVIVIGGGVDTSSNRVAGLSFAFFSTVSAALYVVWMRGLSGKVDYLNALFVVQAVACLISLLVWIAGANTGLAATRTGTAFLSLSAFGTGAIYYGAAFYIYLVGLQKTQASIAGVYLSLVPAFSICLAWVLLAERLASIQWVGAITVVFAIGAISLLSARTNGSNSGAKTP